MRRWRCCARPWQGWIRRRSPPARPTSWPGTWWGLSKLHRATGRAELHAAVTGLWRAIREHHLSLGGGPWGGVAHRSREVFNPAGVFSPQGYVETCSTLAWIQLNRELLAATGDACYAEEIERSAYNDLLGALAPNGEDWCYYVFPNGQRVHTLTGAAARAAARWRWKNCRRWPTAMRTGAGPSADGPPVRRGRRELRSGAGRHAAVAAAHGAIPSNGAVRIEVQPASPLDFTLRLRGPDWAHGASVQVNDESPQRCRPGTTRIAATLGYR